MQALIRKLGDPDVDVRRTAARQLRSYGVAAKEAYEASFGKADVRGMEREWQEYVKKLEPSRK
jgi:hypothetical protein